MPLHYSYSFLDEERPYFSYIWVDLCVVTQILISFGEVCTFFSSKKKSFVYHLCQCTFSLLKKQNSHLVLLLNKRNDKFIL